MAAEIYRTPCVVFEEDIRSHGSQEPLTRNVSLFLLLCRALLQPLPSWYAAGSLCVYVYMCMRVVGRFSGTLQYVYQHSLSSTIRCQ